MKRTFIVNLFGPTFHLEERVIKELNDKEKVKITSRKKYSLKKGKSWPAFLVNYYSYTVPESKRENYFSKTIIEKSILLERWEKSLLVLEVEIENPVTLNYTDEMGHCVPKVLDDYKVKLRKELEEKVHKYCVMHVFDSDKYNQEITNLLRSECEQLDREVFLGISWAPCSEIWQDLIDTSKKFRV